MCMLVDRYSVQRIATYFEEARPRALCLGWHSGAFFLSHDGDVKLEVMGLKSQGNLSRESMRVCRDV